MTALESCLNYLDRNGVRYTHTTHPPAFTAREVAAAEFIPAHNVSKVVVFRSGRGYLLVVVSADSYVDLGQVRAALCTSELQQAEESELRILFPQAETGAMPPLAALADVPVYLDRALAAQEFIAFPAGTHCDAVHMRTADFQRLTHPLVGDFSRSGEFEQPIFPIQF